jgi:protein SCO1/2
VTSPVSDAAVDRRWALLGVVGVVFATIAVVALVVAAIVSPSGAGDGATTGEDQTIEPPYAYPAIEPAPPLDLVDQDGRPFDLASLLGEPVLIFFGYTHCPDVCPATVGVVNRVLGDVGEGPRVLFVSIDPERDTPDALKQYLAYLPEAYSGLTGSAVQVREAADGYHVTYAKVETGSASGYAMAHTAELYLIDAEGRLRSHYPFGTDEAVIADDVAALMAERS